RVYRDGIRALLTGVNGVVLGVSLALMAWGMIDSLIDADGDRPIGLLVIATPALYAGWVTLEIAWRAQRLTDLMARIVTGCLVAPLFVAVPGFMMHALAVALPPFVRPSPAPPTRTTTSTTTGPRASDNNSCSCPSAVGSWAQRSPSGCV